MSRRFALVLGLCLAVVLALGAVPSQSVRAASLGSFTGFTPNVASGCVFGIGNYTIEFTGTVVDLAGLDYVSVVLKDASGNYGDVDFWGVGVSTVGITGDATGFNSAPASRPFTLELYDIGDPTGVVADSPQGLALTLAGTLMTTYTFDPVPAIPACSALPLVVPAPPASFSGPALPANSNLVLITGDIGVQDAPDGQPTGRVMKTCQTAFVVETSSDGKWYRLFVMGGWIPVAATQDVAEAYGQAGFPVIPGCEGK